MRLGSASRAAPASLKPGFAKEFCLPQCWRCNTAVRPPSENQPRPQFSALRPEFCLPGRAPLFRFRELRTALRSTRKPARPPAEPAPAKRIGKMISFCPSDYSRPYQELSDIPPGLRRLSDARPTILLKCRAPWICWRPCCATGATIRFVPYRSR